MGDALSIVDPTWTIAYQDLFDSEEDLDLLRRYRDEYLVKTKNGQLWTNMLYAGSEQALGVLLANPDLRLRANRLINDNLNAVEAVVNGGTGVIANSDEVAAFLADYGERAPASQRVLARLVRKALLKRGEGFFGLKAK